MKKILVELRQCSYFIYVGYELFNHSLCFLSLSSNTKVLVITNFHVASIYLDMFRIALNKLNVLVDFLILPDGEYTKSLVSLNMIFTKLLMNNYDRSTVLVAFGGGVIGDLTGFAAAIYQRGIRFIQVPTTLLAQVDASIGGKTAINHVLGKNMIGAFYQPMSVNINLDFLYTLSSREFAFGLVEVIKYAIAFDFDFFNWLELYLDDVLALQFESLMYCVCRCCEIKSCIVSIDEYDNNIRNLLNLGHTYGHAIESGLQYKWSHGEAVSAGIMMAVSTALRLEKIQFSEAERIKLLFMRINLPISGPKSMVPEDYLKYMIRDKKSTLGKINLVLPVAIGNARLFLDVPHDIVLLAIKDNYSG